MRAAVGADRGALRRARGIQLHQVAGGYQFRTNPDNAQLGAEAAGAEAGAPDARAARDAGDLAYRQPITRPEIDEIRGVDSGGTLEDAARSRADPHPRQEGGAGPADALRHDASEFLEFFNLRDLKDLPTLREFHELSEEHRAQVAALESVAPEGIGRERRRGADGRARAPPLERVSFTRTPPEDAHELDEIDRLIQSAGAAMARPAVPPKAQRRQVRRRRSEPRNEPEGSSDDVRWRLRLQRFLAQAGVASRRKAEELIIAGRVKVNGRVVTELGSKVDPDADKVFVAGKRLLVERAVYLMLNKPRGYVTTMSDPEGRPTVTQLSRAAPARASTRSGGSTSTPRALLICTNDGDLAHALMHPKREVQKTYHVKLRGLLAARDRRVVADGVTLDDGERTAPAEVTLLGRPRRQEQWLEISIHEGKNRQIHRMAEALGFKVAKLTRVALRRARARATLRVGTLSRELIARRGRRAAPRRRRQQAHASRRCASARPRPTSADRRRR